MTCQEPLCRTGGLMVDDLDGCVAGWVASALTLGDGVHCLVIAQAWTSDIFIACACACIK